MAPRPAAIVHILQFCAIALVAAALLPPRVAAASPDARGPERVPASPTAESIVDPSVSDALRSEPDVTVWVYFKDKGERNRDDLERAIAEAESRITAEARARRTKGSAGPFHADALDVPVLPRYIEAVERTGARVRHASRWLNAVSVDADAPALRALAALPFVGRIALVGRTDVALADPTNYGPTLTQNQMINSVAAHDSGYSAAGLVIAVLDTGFRKDHLALAPLKRLAEWDFVQSDSETANQAGDDSHQWDHGTGVWSILGGYWPGEIIGPAFNASFVLAKTHNITHSTKLDEDKWIAATQWADSIGVDIVQSSMVINDPYSQLDGKTTPTAKATNILSRHGILVVTAMGNTGPNLGTLWTPSDCDSMLAVGAVDQNGVITNFSSRGPTIDGRGKPDVVAQGLNTVWANASSTTNIGSVPGTSTAAPLVSGAAALVMEAHPEWTAQQVRYAIKSTASRANAPDSNTYGWGIPNIVAAIYQSSLGPPIYPKPFWLTSPAQGTAISGSGITFRWRRSVDFTPGDAVTYSLVLRKVSPNLVVFSTSTADTFVTLPQTLASGTAYQWSVTASDLAGHLRPAQEAFNFTTTGTLDNPPVVTAPSTVAGAEGAFMSFGVTASDPDGNAITSLTAAPLPTSASFTASDSNMSGTFQWTPRFNQAGVYNVTFTAANALSGQATTQITVADVDRAPVVTAPATVAGAEGSLVSFVVSASDPDGTPITALTAAPLPAGASFTPDSVFATGAFQWTPGFDQAGSYAVTFTGSNSLSGQATTQITIADVDRAPVVTVPATVAGAEGSLVSFAVSAADPDATPIASLTAAPLPAGASFTTNGSMTAGTFQWTPAFDQGGTFSVVFTASNALSGQATTQINVAQSDRPPVVTAPAAVADSEGVHMSFVVSAADPDGAPITSFTAAPLPPGATFTPDGADSSATFEWTPGFDQAGVHGVTFTASNSLSGQATTQITVANVDRAPVVTAPLDVPGVAGSTVTMSVTASDPDGDPIDSLSVTTDSLPAGNDATFTTDPSHTTGSFTWHPALADTGTYLVAVRASNALLTQASVSIRVLSPTGLAVAADTTALTGFPFTLTATATNADTTKVLTITATGAPASLSFAHTPGTSPATATLSGTLAPEETQGSPYTIVWQVSDGAGGTATATTTLRVATTTAVSVDESSTGPPRVLSLRNRPNPFQSATQIDMRVAGRAPTGSWAVRIYDLHGRLVRTLLAGGPWKSTTLVWDGATDRGTRAAAGVYYYRIEGAGMRASRRLILLK